MTTENHYTPINQGTYKSAEEIEAEVKRLTKTSVDNCYLVWGDDGYLTCTFNHGLGEECLMHSRI